MLAKNSMRKKLLAVLFSEPATVTCVPLVPAEVSTGKFCRLLAPVSASFVSFAVTPLLLRSIPRSPFE